MWYDVTDTYGHVGESHTNRNVARARCIACNAQFPFLAPFVAVPRPDPRLYTELFIAFVGVVIGIALARIFAWGIR